MLSSLWLLFSFLPLFITLISGANDQIIPRYNARNVALGDFPDGSDYGKNRNTGLKQIYSDTEIDYGFYNVSLGDKPNQVNAIGICRGDVEPENCRSCLQLSAAFMEDRCSLCYEAIVYYDLCTLRYSNKSIFGVMETDTSEYYQIADKTVVDDAFNQTLNDLLDGLKRTAAEGDSQDEDEVEIETGNDLKVGDLLQFDFATIKLAANNFSDTNKLGQGGFGSVYKGTLSDGHDIAIKRLANNSEQGETEFKNEVLLTGKLQHRNLVKLLDPIKRANLNWEIRYKIIKDVARGLVYLHEDSRLQIVHRDLKTSNILLDDEMNPKITDFGIAKLFDANQTHGMTKTVVGTFGYMAPEYLRYGEFSVKSDVFSYGVIILEIVCGRRIIKNHDGENIEDLLSIAWKNWKAGTSSDIVDPTLDQDFNKNEKLRCIHVALLCVQEDIVVRPSMSSVLLMFNSTSFPLPEPSEPPFLMQPKRTSSIALLSDRYSGPTKSTDSGSVSQLTQGSTTKSSVTDQYSIIDE
ncbi:hypothetical protein TSUD_47330 [Trifolium subterraneum]|nr:hypothetical protein TSUD_47330 [Trifolium subterraneum]